MKKKGYALLAAAGLALAGPAMAATSPALTIGGRTIAGPGKATIPATIAKTVYTHAATNTDACATVINSSKSSSVRISLVGPANATVTFDLAVGATSTLCHDGVVRMDLTCLSETAACSAQWRVDDN